MAKCSICGKGVVFGAHVSHSHVSTNRMWKANVRSVKVVDNGQHKTIAVCTRCLRSDALSKLNIERA